MSNQSDASGPYPPTSKQIKLRRPITVAGQKTDTLTLQEPTLAHAEFLDKVRFKYDQNGVAQADGMGTLALEAAQHLGGLTRNEAIQLSAVDAMAIWAAAMGFLQPSPETGETP
jgi:hypothetical protein